METSMSIPLDLALLKDVILLLISGIACLYCVLLNRRLKGLNDLKSGVGASIVSLTKAIKETHSAAKAAQSSTVESIDVLKELLDKSNEASLRMEAETIALQRNVKRAIAVNAGLQVKVQTDLPEAIEKAQTTASNLLKVVADIEKYHASEGELLTENKADVTPTAKISHLKVVKKPARTTATRNADAGGIEDDESESNTILVAELSEHLGSLENVAETDDVISEQTENTVNQTNQAPEEAIEADAVAVADEEPLQEDIAEDVTSETTEDISDESTKKAAHVETLEEAPILQRIPPLNPEKPKQSEPTKITDIKNVTELNAIEKDEANKDPIDELFDNIDHLVKAKGVSKGIGFLKSREYYKS